MAQDGGCDGLDVPGCDEVLSAQPCMGPPAAIEGEAGARARPELDLPPEVVGILAGAARGVDEVAALAAWRILGAGRSPDDVLAA